MMNDIYWYLLGRIIALSDQRFEYDFWMGTLHVLLPDGRDLYATPGWEGETLPWCVQTDNYSDVDAHGNVHVEWTGNLRVDCDLYMRAIDTLIENIGGV